MNDFKRIRPLLDWSLPKVMPNPVRDKRAEENARTPLVFPGCGKFLNLKALDNAVSDEMSKMLAEIERRERERNAA